MTTARNSRSRSSIAVAFVVATIELSTAPASAHRRDEYLQAARVAIDLHRVQIELDLTPGIAVAERILGEIDGDRNGTLSVADASLYGARVLRNVRVEIDGQPLSLEVSASQAPDVEQVLSGEGTLRLQVIAPLNTLTMGVHRLLFRNLHDTDIGAYLANAFVPASDEIIVIAQRRDTAQQELVIEFIRRGHDWDASWWALAGASAMMLVALRAGLTRRAAGMPAGPPAVRPARFRRRPGGRRRASRRPESA